jgi:hypothetical protein
VTFALGDLTYTLNTGTTNSLFLEPWKTWLEQITYKPGWKFELRFGSGTGNTVNGIVLYSGMNLLVWARVADSNAPDNGELWITHTFPIDQVFTQEQFYQLVLDCVIKVERHEAMEYLKAGGVRVKTPHPEPGLVLY